MSNKAEKNGPASHLRTGGIERPIAVRFDPSGSVMYIVDFGIMTVSEKGPRPLKGTGVLWKVTRTAGGAP